MQTSKSIYKRTFRLAMSSIYFWTDLFDVLNLPIYEKSLTTITESLTVQLGLNSRLKVKNRIKNQSYREINDNAILSIRVFPILVLSLNLLKSANEKAAIFSTVSPEDSVTFFQSIESSSRLLLTERNTIFIITGNVAFSEFNNRSKKEKLSCTFQQ